MPQDIIISPPPTDTPWRLYYREPSGDTWRVAGLFANRKDLNLAAIKLQLKGFYTKPEYLGKDIGVRYQQGGDL